MNSVQIFFASQVKLSRRFDELFFRSFSIDGNMSFVEYVRGLATPSMLVADIGGGKTPFFSAEEVSALGLRVTGVDMDVSELEAAPDGAYSDVIVARVEDVDGPPVHDLIVAQSVLEHVTDGERALLGISSLGRHGARVLTFCPNRRAWFAQLNLLLPENLKRAVLFHLFPSKRERQGYPAFYDGCTPSELTSNMSSAGIKEVEVRYYFVSSYFMFFFPIYLFWRLFTFPFMVIWPRMFCETFVFSGVIEREASPQDAIACVT